MELVKPSFEILSNIDSNQMLKNIEIAGRTCYKSEDRITEESAAKFVEMLLKRGHESVIEHEKISIKFVCDRGVSHELVRHRIASFSQESTRYVNYSKKGIQFIIPSWFKGADRDSILRQSGGVMWITAMEDLEEKYNFLVEEMDWKPEQARSVLPNSLKTEIVVTANLRQWREILRQRTSKFAHPQMRELMIPLHEELKLKLDPIFKTL